VTDNLPDIAADIPADIPTDDLPYVETFQELGVDEALVAALAAKGITSPFPIQQRSLPVALAGDDVIGQARTGTGKTLAFGLALLTRLDPNLKRTQALVIVPTRELCLQVADELAIGAARGITTVAIYGGVPYEEQVEAVRGGAHVAVGTPGRLLDLMQRGDLELSGVTELVLDEADEMLDMGFLPDVERLIEACGTDRHGMLFSATMPTEVVRMARRYLASPTFVRADHEVINTAPLVSQHFLQVHRLDKPRILARILQSPERGNVYVFVRTKMKADRLVEELADLGVDAIAIHGDLRQTTRERNMDRFRDGRSTVLVATEVAARGLDVDNVTHVVNFDCPEDERMYLHRIGRTARAGQAGVAVTFCEHNEIERLNVIRRAVSQEENPIAEVFSTSDELTERFGLPEERPWDRKPGSSGRARSGSAARSDTGARRGSRSRGGDDAGSGGSRDDARSGSRDDARSGSRDDARSGSRSGGRGSGRAASRATSREDTTEATATVSTASADDAPRTSDDAAAPATRTRTRSRSTARGDAPARGDAAERPSERAEARDDADDGAERTGEGRRRRARAGSRSGGGATGTPPSEGGGRERNADGGGRSRSASRSRSRSSEGAGERTADTGERARTDEGTRTGDGGGRSRERSSGSGRSRSGSGANGAGRGGARADDGARDGGDDGARAGGARKRGRSGSGSGSGSGSRSRSGSDSTKRTDDVRAARTPRPKPVDGEAARGEGQPQVARRVRVDHLP
jgi:superfamily II DNA/RNA helicase